MHHYRVGLVCNDSRVLPTLADRLKEPWSTINEEEGISYWSSSHFEALATVYEVDECASRLLSRLNGLVKLYFIHAGELAKAGRIKFANDQGQEETMMSLSTGARAVFKIQSDENLEREARQRWLHIAEKGLEREENSPISQALNHFGKEANWHNLFNVYEIIQKDYNNSRGKTHPRHFIPLPEEWTRDERGRNREKDFTESANNAYVSGITARHSIAMSKKVVQIADSPLLKMVHTNEEILPMTLDRAKIFIAGLLAQWLTKREIVVASYWLEDAKGQT